MARSDYPNLRALELLERWQAAEAERDAADDPAVRAEMQAAVDALRAEYQAAVADTRAAPTRDAPASPEG